MIPRRSTVSSCEFISANLSYFKTQSSKIIQSNIGSCTQTKGWTWSPSSLPRSHSYCPSPEILSNAQHTHTHPHTHTNTHTHTQGRYVDKRNANHSPIEAQSPIQAIPLWSHEAEVPSWSELISGFRQNTRRSDVVTWFAQNPPAPGVEPGPPGWKPGILTARPRGTIRMQHIPPLNMSINKSTHTFPLSYHSPDA